MCVCFIVTVCSSEVLRQSTSTGNTRMWLLLPDWLSSRANGTNLSQLPFTRCSVSWRTPSLCNTLYRRHHQEVVAVFMGELLQIGFMLTLTLCKKAVIDLHYVNLCHLHHRAEEPTSVAVCIPVNIGKPDVLTSNVHHHQCPHQTKTIPNVSSQTGHSDWPNTGATCWHYWTIALQLVFSCGPGP